MTCSASITHECCLCPSAAISLAALPAEQADSSGGVRARSLASLGYFGSSIIYLFPAGQRSLRCHGRHHLPNRSFLLRLEGRTGGFLDSRKFAGAELNCSTTRVSSLAFYRPAVHAAQFGRSTNFPRTSFRHFSQWKTGIFSNTPASIGMASPAR